MIHREYKPSEPEPDYDQGFESGRFRVAPDNELPSKDSGDRNSVPNLAKADAKNSSMEPHRSIDETPKSDSPEAVFKEPHLRFTTLNNSTDESGDLKRNFSTFGSRSEKNLGKENFGFFGEEDDEFDTNTFRTHHQPHSNNGTIDSKIQKRRVENNGQSINTTRNRPGSLQLDSTSQRNITFDRLNSQPSGSSNGSMVLQLVLPQSALRDMSLDSQDQNNPNFTSVTDLPTNEYFTYTPSIISYGNVGKTRNGDIQSAKSPGLSRGFNSSASLHSEAASSHGHYPPPSTCEEKAHMFRSFISVILSCIYAVFLVPIGLVVYIADLLTDDSSLAAMFNLYLVILGFLYLGYLFFDIRSYVSKSKKHWKATTNYDKEDDASPVDLNMNNIPAPNHAFCFALGRHAGSMYLKVGAAVFCFGHLIHGGLILVYEVVFLTSEEFYECFNPVAFSFDIIYPIYSFFLLFFIFKYSNVIINHCKEAARMLIMHTIASSLCFWMWAIFRESVDSVARHASAAATEDEDSAEITALISEDGIATLAIPLTSYQLQPRRYFLDAFNTTIYRNGCQHTELNIIYDTYSPYLYPFTIEYSILIVGILYIIWNNIGNCKRGGGSSAEGPPCPAPAGPTAGSNIIVHADCHHANRGLFAGMLVLVASIVSIILFFVAFSDPQYVEVGKMVNQITELVLLIIMTLAAFLAYRQIILLDINHHPVSLLDDILLFIAIPAFFLYALFSMIPAAQKQDWLKICGIVIGVIQVLIQTPMIIDGLRRCSNAKKLRSKRPGRELITFLIICNVALWIIETFEIKSTDKKDDRYDFYGLVLWTILKHMTVPLIMFYRFHSSVCLADIWKSAYVPGESAHHS